MDVLRDQQVQAARTYVAALSDDEEVGESEGSMFPSIPATALSFLPRHSPNVK